MMENLRLAVRSLWRAPTFTVTVALLLAVGFGFGTAVYSAAYSLLLRPLPYFAPDSLVSLYEIDSDGTRQGVALENALDWQQSSSSFEDIGIYRKQSQGLKLKSADDVLIAQSAMSTPGLLTSLGVEPSLGRIFTYEESRGAVPVAVITHRLRMRLFDKKTDVVGESIILNERRHTIIGVLPEDFEFPVRNSLPDVLVPLSYDLYGRDRTIRTLSAVARLKPGVTIGEARTELRTIAARLASQYPDTNRGFGIAVEALDTALRGGNRRPMLLLSVASTLLIVVTLSNAINLVVIRALRKSREVATRMAIGSTLTELLRYFLAEAVLLGCVGALTGYITAKAAQAFLPRLLPLVGGVPLPVGLGIETFPLDAVAVALAIAFAAISIFAFALVPLSVARRLDIRVAMQTEAGRGPGKLQVGAVSIVLQICLSTVLVAASGLLLQSYRNVVAKDPGFEAEGAVVFGIGLPGVRYDSERKMIAFHETAIKRLAEIPGVAHVGGAARLPMAADHFWAQYRTEEESAAPTEWPWVAMNIASPGYFEALKTPLVAGRTFRWTDTPDSPRVVVIDRPLAETLGPVAEVLGSKIELSWASDLNPPGTLWEVVGIVESVHQVSLDQDPAPQIYASMGQFPTDGSSYLLRTARHPGELTEPVRAVISSIDGMLQRVQLSPMQDVVSRTLGPRRLALRFSIVFSVLVLIVSIIGIYGAVAYEVQRRLQEIAIRVTLGAKRGDVIALFVTRATCLAAVGALAGVLLALLLMNMLRGMLYGIAATDVPNLVLGAIMMVGIAAAASAAPVLRAASGDHVALNCD